MSLRVLHAVRSLRRETGGLAETVRNLVAAQRARGATVTIASLDPADAVEANLVVLGERSHGYGYAPRYVPWLRAHAGDFDFIAVHGLWQYQSFGAWRALRGGVTPYAVFCHGMLDPWFKRAHPLKHAKKWCYWPWAEYRALRDAAAVCFAVDEERRLARESFRLYRVRERVVPIGIPGPPGEPEAECEIFFTAHPELRGKKFLLFLARLHPKKAIELLLAGYAAAWPGGAGAPVLVIAGPCDDETYLDRLKGEAARRGIAGAVCWLPMLTGGAKWGALRACEAFALFSHQENFGVAVVEALACARPVLLSEPINISRMIAMDGAGLVVPDTIAGASDALRRWRDLPAEKRRAMGAAAQACFEKRFAVARAAEAFATLAAELKPVAGRGGPRA